jgi:tRNA A-37 threonylcarbamoyl transferase component Bud32/energy-coupling factor transporter ATP-binding protein EcfA2
MKSELPDISYFIGKEIPDVNGFKIVKHIDSGCNAHVFKAYNENIKGYLACKVIPRSNLKNNDDKDSWYKEAQIANTLKSRSVVKCYHHTEFIDSNNSIDCVALCFDYIEGISLRKFIKDNKNDISIGFIEELLRTLFELLFELENRAITHGDLHAGNIIVQQSTEEQLIQNDSFYVTDFGVGKSTYLKELKDDYENIAITLRELISNVHYQDLEEARDRFAFNILNDGFLGRYLLETDTNIEPFSRNPHLLYEELTGIDEKFKKREREVEHRELLTPFDYLSCEQIGDAHSILKALYSDKFISLSAIQDRNNVILTGPRGCGKSTVYKSLSLFHRVLVEDAEPANINYIGLYYRCDDLYFTFPRFKNPENENAIDIPLHFLTATLAIELLQAIDIWSKQHFQDSYSKTEQLLSQRIWGIITEDEKNEPGLNTVYALIRRLGKERKRAAKRARFLQDKSQNFGNYFGPDVLLKICDVVRTTLTYISEKPIYFFVDDYSYPKITFELQQNLNRLLMQRSASCFFKLSTESPVSYLAKDIDEKMYVEGREIKLINVGLNYLAENKKMKLAFVEDVFERRLNAVKDYPVKNIQELLGKGERSIGNVAAKQLREKKKVLVWGKNGLVDICSGDIHYIINLVGKMVEGAGGVNQLSISKNIPLISTATQNRIIRDQAGNFLNNLRNLSKDGKKLVEIVTAFGKIAHYYVLNKDSSNQGRLQPHQASRIEPYDELDLTNDSMSLYRELLRYSLFIEDRRGKSIRGSVVPRLYLRRFLIPYFNLTFSKRDSIKFSNSDFEELFSDPNGFYDNSINKLKNQERSDDKKVNNDLFEEKNDWFKS